MASVKNYIEFRVAWWFRYLYTPFMILRTRFAKFRGVDLEVWIEKTESEVVWVIGHAIKKVS